MLAFDIDGTLAPIVAEPWRAHISDELRACLRSLAAQNAGRDHHRTRGQGRAAACSGFSPHYVVGNHGAEGIPGFEAQSSDFQRVCAAWLAELSATRGCARLARDARHHARGQAVFAVVSLPPYRKAGAGARVARAARRATGAAARHRAWQARAQPAAAGCAAQRRGAAKPAGSFRLRAGLVRRRRRHRRGRVPHAHAGGAVDPRRAKAEECRRNVSEEPGRRYPAGPPAGRDARRRAGSRPGRHGATASPIAQ